MKKKTGVAEKQKLEALEQDEETESLMDVVVFDYHDQDEDKTRQDKIIYSL